MIHGKRSEGKLKEINHFIDQLYVKCFDSLLIRLNNTFLLKDKLWLYAMKYSAELIAESYIEQNTTPAHALRCE